MTKFNQSEPAVFTEIPTATLNAIKKMMFSSKNGVDLTNIVADLNMGCDDDLTAINVGLAFNGVKPDIDTATRYEKCYGGFKRIEFVGFSLINGNVRARVAYMKKNPDEGDFYEDYSEERVISIHEWYGMATSDADIVSTIK